MTDAAKCLAATMLVILHSSVRRVDLRQQPNNVSPCVRMQRQQVDDVGPAVAMSVAVAEQV
jgi:hypothetical protein